MATLNEEPYVPVVLYREPQEWGESPLEGFPKRGFRGHTTTASKVQKIVVVFFASFAIAFFEGVFAYTGIWWQIGIVLIVLGVSYPFAWWAGHTDKTDIRKSYREQRGNYIRDYFRPLLVSLGFSLSEVEMEELLAGEVVLSSNFVGFGTTKIHIVQKTRTLHWYR